MARSTRITKIDRRGQRCTLITFRGGGAKGQIEVPGGIQEFRQWIRDSVRESHETLVAMALMCWLQKNPAEGSDFSSIEGRQITLDFDAPTVSGIVTII